MDIEYVRGLVVGLLLGAGVAGHVLRLVTLEPLSSGATGRHGVALVAIAIYSVAALLVGCDVSAGYWIAILGPVGGVTAVLATGNTIDRFQVVLGVPQAIAGALSIVALLG
jgi:hypothetical protein